MVLTNIFHLVYMTFLSTLNTFFWNKRTQSKRAKFPALQSSATCCEPRRNRIVSTRLNLVPPPHLSGRRGFVLPSVLKLKDIRTQLFGNFCLFCFFSRPLFLPVLHLHFEPPAFVPPMAANDWEGLQSPPVARSMTARFRRRCLLYLGKRPHLLAPINALTFSQCVLGSISATDGPGTRLFPQPTSFTGKWVVRWANRGLPFVWTQQC